jgi:DNA polymerase I-like protein with 3'-5' exonuclease and polymerase domains
MKPFFQKSLFDIQDIPTEIIKSKKKVDLCSKCGLKIKSENSYLNEKSDILVIIDFYNQNIDYIKEKLKDYKYTLTFALQCENKNNITVNQINCCRDKLKKVIEKVKPKKILTFGLYSLQSLIGDKVSVTSIDEWVGWQIPDQDFGCFIFPNYYIEDDKKVVLSKKFNEYLYTALNYNRKFKEILPEIKICNEKESVNYLNNILALKEEIIAIDYESSGLKPHKKGHFIYSVAITQNNLFTFSFLLTENNKKLLIEILQNKNISKIIQNASFEYKWSKVILNCEIENIIFDTQLASHIIDNRSGITGLKFQTYVNFGIVGYEESIDSYIKSKEIGSNIFNNIKNAPINELLLYNGYDSYFTMLLYKKQKYFLDEHIQKGFSLFLEGNIELSRLSGIKFDKQKAESNYQELTLKIDGLHIKIMGFDEVQLLKKKDNHFQIGTNIINFENFNYDSPVQLKKLLFDVCKWENLYNSVDEECLKKLNKSLTNLILERRKLIKIRDTYLSQFMREAVEIDDEYFIFPFFSLNNVVSFRSGSQAPNFQNVPVRNIIAMNMTRSCIIPRNGHQLLEIDFKGMEVGTSCMYHNDSMMINYVQNKANDMHGDIANKIFFRKKGTKNKVERNLVKGDFVFAQFYGSTARIYTDEQKKLGYGEVTLNLWEGINEESKQQLFDNGIKDIYDFQNHILKIEEEFWNETFEDYKQWKFDNWREYKEKGYIDTKTGFRLNAIMGFNQANNFPIQGTAFHIALKTLIELNKFLRKEKFKSVIIGEIHDSIIIDCDPSELRFIAKIIKDIIYKIKQEWAFINVDLTVEFAVTGINESWANKKEIEL